MKVKGGFPVIAIVPPKAKRAPVTSDVAQTATTVATIIDEISMRPLTLVVATNRRDDES